MSGNRKPLPCYCCHQRPCSKLPTAVPANFTGSSASYKIMRENSLDAALLELGKLSFSASVDTEPPANAASTSSAATYPKISRRKTLSAIRESFQREVKSCPFTSVRQQQLIAESNCPIMEQLSMNMARASIGGAGSSGGGVGVGVLGGGGGVIKTTCTMTIKHPVCLRQRSYPYYVPKKPMRLEERSQTWSYNEIDTSSKVEVMYDSSSPSASTLTSTNTTGKHSQPSTPEKKPMVDSGPAPLTRSKSLDSINVVTNSKEAVRGPRFVSDNGNTVMQSVSQNIASADSNLIFVGEQVPFVAAKMDVVDNQLMKCDLTTAAVSNGEFIFQSYVNKDNQENIMN